MEQNIYCSKINLAQYILNNGNENTIKKRKKKNFFYK